MPNDELSNLGFIDCSIARIERREASATVWFEDEFDKSAFGIEFGGVVYLRCSTLDRITDSSVADDTKEITQCRREHRCLDGVEIQQLNLLDGNNFVFFAICFGSCRLLGQG